MDLCGVPWLVECPELIAEVPRGALQRDPQLTGEAVHLPLALEVAVEGRLDKLLPRLFRG